MGEAAEYEIWRRHGVDISDDGWLDRHYGDGPRRRSHLSPADLENRRRVNAKRAADKAARREERAAYEASCRAAPAGVAVCPPATAPWYSQAASRAQREASEKVNPTVAKAATPIRSKYTMNTAEAITLIQLSQGARIVAGSYDTKDATGAPYHFKDVLGLGLRTGDIAIVQTKDGFSLVKIISADVLPTDCGCSLDKLKHVVAKLDTDALDAVLATERQAVHRLAMSEVTDRLSTYRKQLGEGGFGEVERLLAPAAPESNFRPNAQTEEALRDSRAGRTHRATGLDAIIDEVDIPDYPRSGTRPA